MGPSVSLALVAAVIGAGEPLHQPATLQPVHDVGQPRLGWRHNGAMPSVQIKDVPDDIHAVLRQRAAAAHQSLQEYLRSRLIAEASRPTLEEILDRAGALDARRAELALNDLSATPIKRAPHLSLLRRCWELRDNLTTYDASYVALAEALDVLLLTGDRRLARASGPRCQIELLRPTH